MRRIKGLHDIRTHGSLAQEGKLISVARDWHRTGSNRAMDETASGFWDGKVEQHLYKKGPTRTSPLSRTAPLPFLYEKIKIQQIQMIQDLIKEVRQAMTEGIPVAKGEFQRLEARLSQLKAE